MTHWKRYAPAVVLVAGLTLVGLYARLNGVAVETSGAIEFVIPLMLAATAVAVLRNEVGVSTFGVFGPVIIALAWIEAGALWGFLLVAYAFVVTATARSALDGLDLGTPHRVGALLVVASVSVVVFRAVGDLQGVPGLEPVLLFPVIVTAWYAERFVESVAGTGWAPASRRLLFTLIAVLIAFAVASFDPLVDAFAQTPETWAGLVALNVLLGTRTDTRLTEYARFRALRAAARERDPGVLTMRVRNRDFITRYNPAPLLGAHDKRRTKEVLHGLDVPTPETLLVVRDRSDLEALRSLLAEREQFVLKPVDGTGGSGVLVVRGRDGERFDTNRGSMTADGVVAHARRIVVGGTADYGDRTQALVEALVTPGDLLADRVTAGVPDLRVVTLFGYPVMAMLRLPTEESNGTANIHTGAVAVAVDVATGETAGGYQQTRDRFLSEHPDTGASLSLTVPDWPAVLATASRAAVASGLGYTGVDVVFDADRGPTVLEVNRRPGLGIQNANVDGLLRRLRFVEAQDTGVRFLGAEERVAHAIEWARQDWAPAPAPTPPEAAPEGVGT